MSLIRHSPRLLILACLVLAGCTGAPLKGGPPGEAAAVAEKTSPRGESSQAPPPGVDGQKAASAAHPKTTQVSPPSLISNTMKVTVRDNSGSPWKVDTVIRHTVEKVFKECPDLTLHPTATGKYISLLKIEIAAYEAKAVSSSQDKAEKAVSGGGRYLGMVKGEIRVESSGKNTLRRPFEGHCSLSRKPETPQEISAALYDAHSLVETLIAIVVEQSGPQCAVALIAQDDPLARLARTVLINTGQPAVEPLAKVLHDNALDVGWRRAAVIVLGHIKDPQAVKILIEALNHSDFWIQYYAAVALIERGDGRTIAMLVSAMNSSTAYERERIHKVLVEATGVNLGLDPVAWQQWWTANKKRFP